MRLINARKLVIEDFTLRKKPKYAILSHTWGEGEVILQDMTTAHRSNMDGWSKIAKTCELAISNGYEYAWVDTCCIDKTSSAELSEAINSMFKWYQEAAVCYIYLSDLDDGSRDSESLFKCRWWTRGWTLQELLASRNCSFFDCAWTEVGNKEELKSLISEYTMLPEDALCDPDYVFTYAICSRMCWAANRRTTRLEDEAYCLLGLFGVNMPLIYGEGRNAFRRLQEEIIKRGADFSMLLCNPYIVVNDFANILAEYPNHFGSYPALRPIYNRIHPEGHISVDGRYLSSSLGASRLFLARDVSSDGEGEARYCLHCAEDDFRKMYIPLKKIGPSVFVREGKIMEQDTSEIIEYSFEAIQHFEQEMKIVIEPTFDTVVYYRHHHERSIRLRWPGQSVRGVISAQPTAQFDHAQDIFLGSRQHLNIEDIAAVVLELDMAVYELPKNRQIVVLFNLGAENLAGACRTLIIFWKGDHPELEEYMFSDYKDRRSLRWPKLRRIAGGFLDKQSDKIWLRTSKGKSCIAASVGEGILSTPIFPGYEVRIDFLEQPSTSN